MKDYKKIAEKQKELIICYKNVANGLLLYKKAIIRIESELEVLYEKKEEEAKEVKNAEVIITVSKRIKDILNLGDNENSVHDANIMDRYQNEAIRFLANQIDILHNYRIKNNNLK